MIRTMIEFETYLRLERSLAEGTIHNYIACLTQFKDTFNKEVERFTVKDIQAFLAQFDKKNKPTYLSALRIYFNWLTYNKKRRLYELCYYLSTIRIKHSRPIPFVPSPDEIKRLRETLQTYKKAYSYEFSDKYKNTVRDICIVELLITTGIRSNELRHLNYGDVDLEEKTISIRVGKFGKQRVSLFNGSASNALQEYFQVNNFKPNDLLFPFKEGNVLNYILKRWAKKSKINQKLHSHSFRHYFITQAQKLGMRLEIIAEQVGHKNLDSTRYYSHYNTDFLRQHYSKINI